MFNRRKNKQKLKYVTPSLFIEEMELWEMIAGTGGEVNASDVPDGGESGNDFIEDAKSNNIFFYEEEIEDEDF